MKKHLLKLLILPLIYLGASGLAWAHHPVMNPERRQIWTNVIIAVYGLYWLLAFLAVLAIVGIVMLVFKLFRKGNSNQMRPSSQRRRPLSGGWAWLQALWALAFPIIAVVCICNPDWQGFFFFYNPVVFAATYVVRILFWRRDVARIKEAGYTVGAWRFWGLILSPVYLLFRAVRTDGKLRYFWLSLALYLLLGSPFVIALG